MRTVLVIIAAALVVYYAGGADMIRTARAATAELTGAMTLPR